MIKDRLRVTNQDLLDVLSKQNKFNNFDQAFRSLMTLLENYGNIDISFKSSQWDSFIVGLKKSDYSGRTFEEYISGDVSLNKAWEIISQRMKV